MISVYIEFFLFNIDFLVMENKLVSIIVSVYNGERYIEECIESVLNQDYKNIELILVDDGSFDSSNVILDKYSLKDKRVKVIIKRILV